MAFNLQEYILFRTEIKRELTNGEVDTNFQMVSNPWVTTRLYEEGNIVYHPVIVDDPATTGEDQVLAWWRANKRTTQGTFVTSEWDIIGGLGSGNINVAGANGFGKINVNSTAATGPLQTGSNALITSVIPNDTFNLIAGQGMSLEWNLGSKSIKVVNTLASNPGEANDGINIGQGTSHQDIYAGKSGVSLQFRGLDVTNNIAWDASVGSALTLTTNNTQDNIVYNLDEGLINLANLNSGLPKTTMLSDVSSTAPTNGYILQWSQANTEWTPVNISVLGSQNIYNVDGTIASAGRVVTLASGPLAFNNPTTAGTGLDIEGGGGATQLRLRNASATGTASTQYSLNAVAVAAAGFFGIDSSFGISIGATGLQGLSIDGLSISSNNELFIPDVATSSVTATGVSFRIPFVNEGTVVTGNTALDKGKFMSSNNYDLTTYTDQGAAIDMISVTHEGRYSLKGVSQADASTANSLSIDSEHDYVNNASLETGVGLLMTYKTPTTIEANTLINDMSRTDRRFIGINFNSVVSGMPVGDTVNKYVGSNIALDDMLGSTAPLINVGQLIAFSNTTGTAGVSPQRVGVYSNIVNDYTGGGSQNGEQVLNQLIADSNSWAGYFVGCVNIDQGGLVLPSSATKPVCSNVSGSTIPDRTLWINSSNGHLYRGDIDVEAAGASSLNDLTDVTINSGTLTANQILAYNAVTTQWDNVTLAPYNIQAIQLATGGNATIRLSDGSGNSDIDLIPGSGIDLVVDETSDTITISATGGGGGGAQGAQGTIGAQGAQGVAGTGAQGAQGVQGNQGDNGAQGNQGAQGVAGTGAQGAQGNQGNQGDNGAQGNQGGDGAQGAQGVAGTGAQGAQGNQGDNGAQGNQGGDGAQGAQGVAGTGAQGAQGVQGNQGDNGAQGNQGAQGVAGTGAQGAQGNQGNQGDDGAQGNQGGDGAQGAQGVAGTGAQGAQGAQGNQGNQGDDGAQGAQGVAGTGAQGAQGAQGNQGNQGNQGDDGAQGAQGVAGTGAQGAQGAQGNQGNQGDDGAQGNQGGDGAQGNQGAQGAQGAQGVQGTAGAQGDDGAQGNQGGDGAQGNQGAQGAQGAQGVQGVAGTGAQGAQGANGAQGNQGADGAQGAQGVQGAQGLGTATLTANTSTVVDIQNVLGNYCNMASANGTSTYTFTNTPNTVGGFGRVLINRTSAPIVTSANLINGDPFQASTDMYMTIQYNGHVTQYWFELIN